MAFDAGFLKAICYELNEILVDGKVEKVNQPSKDEVTLLIRKFGESHKLCIRAGSNLPRLSLTKITKDNPAVAPMFCMLLRKHLGGARFLRATQLGFERVAELAFAAYDDMGFPCEKFLMCEIMGKYSNLMLLDGNHKVLAVMRAVDFSTSRLRQVLPGMTYELPPPQEKTNPLEETKEHFDMLFCNSQPDLPIEKFITKNYLGTATQIAKEIAYIATGLSDGVLQNTTKDLLFGAFSTWMDKLKRNEYIPTKVTNEAGETLDFTYAPIHIFGNISICQSFSTFGELLDRCYGEKEKSARTHQRAQDLFQILDRSMGRITRKIDAQKEELKEAEKGELWQRKGDLVTANLWKLKRGDKELVTEDYYDENVPIVTIELDTRMSPSANAQKFYKYYAKAKHAKVILTEQIALAEKELTYLATVLDALERSTTETDLLEIRDELYRTGYASKAKGYAPPKQMKTKPDVYESPSGYKVYVGRNNIQNDYLTFHFAEKGDLWFHVKGVPGSHVILVCGGEEPPAEDYTFAAELALEHSSVSGDGIPVDYTRVKNVKKPPAAKPGYVTYSTNYTAYVSSKKKEN